MDDKFQKLKQATKIVLKTMSKPIIATIIVIVLVLTLISGFIYVITLNDGSYKKGDKKNVSYVVEQHTGNVSISSDGKITTGKSAKELWDEMIKNKTRVSTYLNNASELKKLITAEMITKYIDTRANPNDPIDWTKYNRDIDSTEVQGIIKLKRAYDDGTNALLTYVDPDTFQDYIDEYNKTGSEADKKKALSHFTLEKGYNGSASFGSGEAIAAGTVINVPAGLGSVHTYMGWQMITVKSSDQYKLREQAGMNFDSEGFGRINGRYVIACTTTFGQPGDYIDFYQEDGTVIQCIIGDTKNQNDAGCTEWGHKNGTCIIEFVVDKNTWYNTNHPNPGEQGFHSEWNKNITKAVNGGSYFTNPNFGVSTGSEDTGDDSSGGSTIGSGLMKWPTDGTNISSYFGLRTQPLPGASTNHGAVDIKVPTGTNVYATEAGTVIAAGYAGNAGNRVTIDHGNGYVSKYMHNSSIKVSVGDKVTKGQVIAISGNTGNSSGPHVHFQIEYYGTKIDPLSFKYDNNMGDGTGGIGSNSDALSTNSSIYAKVATWNEITDTLTSNDPSVQSYSNVTYNMSSTKVDYEQLVSGYQMPFDYLWSLLVVGKEKNFVFDLAELVYNSELVVTVHDNLSTNTNVSVDTYTKKTKTITSDVRVNVKYSSTKSTSGQSSSAVNSATEVGGPFERETSVQYKTTHTVVTKTNTIEAKVTRANVWIVDYTQDFTYQTPTATSTNSSITHDDEEYPESPNRTDGSDGAGLGAAFRDSVQSGYAAQYGSATATLESLKSAYYDKTVNRSVSITNTVRDKKYVASPAKIVEKTDKQSKEPNFVTLYNKHNKAANSINSATQWLFKIMESSEDTKDMIDLTKYLLYKATNRDYGVTEFDFSIFNPDNFASLSDQYGGKSNIEGVPGQIYDFLLGKGVSPVAAAAIVGNVEEESSFNSSAINQTSGCSGLFQYGGDRLTRLKSLASQKGTTWTDVQTQLEYMWSELESDKSDVRNVIMNSTKESDMEYATWYWGRYYEIFFVGNSFETSKGQTARRYEYAKKWYAMWQKNHSSGSGTAQLGEAAKITGTEARIAWLYDGKGLPTSKAENDKYLETFPVEYLDRAGNRQTMTVKMHRKLKTEVQAIFKEMADVGFKIVGGDISYRTWGSDSGFKGRFPQSAHTYGHAFDVNPDQNYCIYGNGTVVGKYYRPGSDPYSVTTPIINIWKKHGFYWGGDWHSPQDYMHFSYFNH